MTPTRDGGQRRAHLLWLSTALLGVAVAISCGGTAFPRETTAANARTDDPWLEGERCPAGFHDDGALRVEQVAAGTGKVVGDGDTVRVRYVAQLGDGTIVHDTGQDRTPIEIIIGSTKVVCGFERALLGMHAGEMRRATVPWRLAFGESGKLPDVQPRTDLVFVIELYLPATPTLEQGGGAARPASGRGGGGGGGRGGH